MATVALERLSKRYGEVCVLESVDLDVADGEYIVLLGRSGCGKSTLLRCIAGLEEITAGELRIAGRRVNDVAPRDRDVAMVFQSYALYPHLTVRDNLAFALRIARRPDPEVAAAVEEAAAMLELGPLLDRLPAQLSGGQRQRVAIGRAIVRRPAVFLFDEPLSNLDAALRGHMRIELKRLHRRLGATIFHVTHDHVEALTLADRIVLLDRGRIQQIGTPRDVFDRPANTFVAAFVGSPTMNLFPATAGGGYATLEGTSRRVALAGEGPLTLGLRPGDLRLDPEGSLTGVVDVVESLGDEAIVHVDLDGARLVARLPGTSPPAAGATISLTPTVLHRFDRETGARLL